MVRAAQRSVFSRPLREYGIDKSVVVPKCQRSCEASAAQRVGWNTLFDGYVGYGV
jgi:hypothetical protein